MRCKACNRVMTPVWIEERNEHETHCDKCKTVEGVREYLPGYVDPNAEVNDDDSNEEGTS